MKKEFVLTYGNKLVVSGLGARTRQVAQQSSNFSNLKTLEVVPSIVLVVGIAKGVEPPEQVYNTIGLVLQKVVQF